MPGRGRQTFNKRQKEQQRKEKQQDKFARREQRKLEKLNPTEEEPLELLDGPPPLDFDLDMEAENALSTGPGTLSKQ